MNPVVLAGAEGNQLELMQWGLVPFWSKEAKAAYSTINARVESVVQSPTYRRPFHSQRCLVPASGFYEWQTLGNVTKGEKKQPFYFELGGDEPEGALFAFAGLYDIWHGPDGQELKSYTIITTQGNELVGEVHDRMPVILPREVEQRWLDPQLEDSAALMQLLMPYPATLMLGFPVSKAVNSPNSDGRELIAPLVS
jgi:putative SOS response-associated peptidase YedK